MTPAEILALANHRPAAPSSHVMWPGPVVAGRPVTVLKGRTVDVQTVIWIVAAHREVPATYRVSSTCGHTLCVRAGHLRASAPPRPGYTALTWLGEPAEFVPDVRPPGSTCVRGHDLLDLGDVYWYRDKANCRACQREHSAAAAARAGKPRQHLKDNGGRYTRCRRGHMLDGDNLLVERSGVRRCKACYDEKEQRKRDKRRQQAGARESGAA